MQHDPIHRHLEPIPASWALETAADLDRLHPGFLRSLLRTKPVQRHALLAALACPSLGRFLENATGDYAELDDQAMSQIAALLLVMKPREIVEAAYSACPDGLLGAFSRIRDPLSPEDYRGLVAMFCDKGERARRQVLSRSPRITGPGLAALTTLASPLCYSPLAGLVTTVSRAAIANAVLEVVQRHRAGLTEEEVQRYVSEAPSDMPFKRQLQRLLTLIEDLPALPFMLPEPFVHLRRAAEFREAGRRFGNCLETKFIPEALSGRVAYLTYADHEAVAVLFRFDQGWVLTKVHAPSNAPPSAELVDAVRTRISEAGVGIFTPRPIDKNLIMVRQLFHHFDHFGLNDDEFDDCDW